MINILGKKYILENIRPPDVPKRLCREYLTEEDKQCFVIIGKRKPVKGKIVGRDHKENLIVILVEEDAFIEEETVCINIETLARNIKISEAEEKKKRDCQKLFVIPPPLPLNENAHQQPMIVTQKGIEEKPEASKPFNMFDSIIFQDGYRGIQHSPPVPRDKNEETKKERAREERSSTLRVGDFVLYKSERGMISHISGDEVSEEEIEGMTVSASSSSDVKYTVVMEGLFPPKKELEETPEQLSGLQGDTHCIVTKICKISELTLDNNKVPIEEWTSKLVLQYQQYARVHMLKNPNRKGTITRALNVPPLCQISEINMVSVKFDKEERQQSCSIGRCDIYDLVFDQHIFEMPEQGQLVCSGPSHINAERILYHRVMLSRENSPSGGNGDSKNEDQRMTGTLVSYSPHYGLHIILDQKNAKQKDEIWVEEKEAEYIFTNPCWKTPIFHQALTVPHQYKSQNFLGQRVKDTKGKKLGTLVAIRDLLDEDSRVEKGEEEYHEMTSSMRKKNLKSFDIWWDCSKEMENLTEPQAAGTLRFLGNVVDEQSDECLHQKQRCLVLTGQVVTKARKGYRVMRGPHFPNTHGANVLGTILNGTDDDEVMVQLDNKSWPLTCPIGKNQKFALCYANQHWVSPMHGQLVTRGMRGARVVRCFAELHNGKNWGTVFSVDSETGSIRIIWHDTEKVEKVSHLPDNLRFVVDSN